MKSVLLFFAWLTLCCSSLAVNGVKIYTPNCQQISVVQEVNFSKKEKAANFLKIKLQTTKMRSFCGQFVLSAPFFNIHKAPIEAPVVLGLSWIVKKEFFHQFIFSCLYPKHSFW